MSSWKAGHQEATRRTGACRVPPAGRRKDPTGDKLRMEGQLGRGCGSRLGRCRREAGRAAGAAGPRAPASRSTSPSRCRPERRTPHSPAPRPPQVRPPATPRAPAPPGSRRGSRLRPSSTVTELRCAAQAEAGKVSARGGVRRRGLSARQPILKKETEENGRAAPGNRKSFLLPASPARPGRGVGFRFRVASLCGALLKLSGRHGADGRVRRV